MKIVIMAAVALFSSTGLLAGTDYYVDAVNGNDAWDGSAAEHEENTDIGPKRTLAAACALLESNKYDVLHAAPGDYNEGVVTNTTLGYKGVYGACLFRVELPPTSSLIATGSKEETFIYGAAATINPDSDGRGTNALRCVYANNALVKGFTILNGRSLYGKGTPADDNGCRGGGVIGGGFIVDCVVSNCYAGRGGGMFSAKAIRTVFGTNGAYEGTDMSYCTAFNCLFKAQAGASNSSCYNCTAKSTIGVNSRFWNCVSLSAKGNGNTLHSSVYVTNSGTTTDANILDGSHQATAAEINLDGDNVPCPPSVLINVGSNEVYEANWPTSPLVAEFKYQDLHGKPRVIDGQIDIGACESRAKMVFYVDAERGDDGNDGVLPGEGHARQTLAGIMKLAHSGDVIHAARGVYDKGEMYLSNFYSNRVVVASGVVLVADEGPDVTFIKGKMSTAEGNVRGCAIDSLRCVYANSGSVVKGFTIIDGHSYYPDSGSNNANGGGASGSGLFVDCCFSNNVALNRGDAAANGSTLLRCRVANGGSYPLYSNVKMVNCIYDSTGESYSYNTAYNTTFLRGGVRGGGGSSPDSSVWNCLFLGSTTRASVAISNCYCTGVAGSGTVVDNRSRFSISEVSLAIDAETKRPEAGSLAVDNGLAEHYARATSGWSATWREFAGEDFSGGQRVYNGVLDIGAGEYDWRGDFARSMRKDQKRDFAVTVADEAVATNALGRVSLSGGCSLTAEWTLPKDDDCSFAATVVGEGSLSALLDGEPLAPGPDGIYRFSATEGAHTLEFSYSGDGEAALHDFTRAGYGLLLMLK